MEQQKIKRAEKFKYLGEWITPNISEKEAIISRINKMEVVYQLTRGVYSKCPSTPSLGITVQLFDQMSYT